MRLSEQALRQDTTTEALLVWALQVQRADVGSAAQGRVGPADFSGRVSADGSYQCFAQGLLGTRVDHVGSARLDRGTWLHPDAETAYALASAYPPPTNLLVLAHARAGTRPDWRPELKRWQAVGELALRQGRYGGKIAYTSAAEGRHKFCRVHFRDRRRELEAARAQYRAWWCALRDLTAALRAARLTRWTITEIGAPERPWTKKP